MGIPTLTLNDGTKVPGVAYGTGTKWFKGPAKNDGSELSEPLIDALKAALAAGFTHIDAAEVYGTDPEIGAVLKGADRSKLYVTNKARRRWKIFPGLGDIPGSAAKMVERLGGPVDLYLIHAPFFDAVGQKDLTIKDAWKAMEGLVEKGGVTKSIGVSNFDVPQLEELLMDAKIKPAVNQVEFNPYLQQPELRAFCEKNGIVLAAYTPLGPLTHFTGGPLDGVLKELEKKYGKTAEQLLLKWTVQQGVLAVTTSSKPERLSLFLAGVDDSWKLDAADLARISEAGSKKHARKYWDKQYEKADEARTKAAEAKAAQ
ncbi:NADP-dependent oxidoreductase domain-containing protein [Hyaloraphidium curvatum]|nr:NADP-dependent oxidoreductase domain-containing protein [Hyaloraphidium curvatum]